MNNIVRTRESNPACGSDAVQAFLEFEAAANNITETDVLAAEALLATGTPELLSAALKVPASNRDVTVAIGALVAAFPSASNKPDLDAYAAVLVDMLPDGLSNLVLRLAVKRLIRHQRFLPPVGAILEAIEDTEREIWYVQFRLKNLASMVPRERTVWIEKDRDLALWREVEALAGHSFPTDARGGWELPWRLVEVCRREQREANIRAELAGRRADEAAGPPNPRPKAITGAVAAPPLSPSKPRDAEHEALDSLVRAVWRDVADGKIGEEEAQRRIEALARPP